MRGADSCAIQCDNENWTVPAASEPVQMQMIPASENGETAVCSARRPTRARSVRCFTNSYAANIADISTVCWTERSGMLAAKWRGRDDALICRRAVFSTADRVTLKAPCKAPATAPDALDTSSTSAIDKIINENRRIRIHCNDWCTAAATTVTPTAAATTTLMPSSSLFSQYN